MRWSRLRVLSLLLLLSLAVPAFLADLECMVGPQDCCACQEDAEADDCSAAALAASRTLPPEAPSLPPVLAAPVPPTVRSTSWSEPGDLRAPREGPPPLASGLRAPPA